MTIATIANNEAGSSVRTKLNALIAQANISTDVGAAGQIYVFEGDSLTLGNTSPNTVSYPAALIAKSFISSLLTSSTNVATGGETLANMSSQYAAQVYPQRPAATGSSSSTLFIWAGANDYQSVEGSGTYTDAAGYVTALETYWAQAKADGFRVVAFTLLRRTDLGALLPAEQTRIEINERIRQSSTYDLLIDADRLFPDPDDRRYFLSGGIHLSDTGNRRLADHIMAVITSRGRFTAPYYDAIQRDSRSWLYLSGAAGGTLNLSAVSDLTPGTGDFLAAAWVYLLDYPANGTTYDVMGGGSNSFGMFINRDGSWGALRVNSAVTITSSERVPLGVWTHLAIGRTGTTIYAFRNGRITDTATDSGNYSTQTNEIGARASNNSTTRFKGYMADATLLKSWGGKDGPQRLMATGAIEGATYGFRLRTDRPSVNSKVQDDSGNGHFLALPSGARLKAGDTGAVSEAYNSAGTSLTNNTAADVTTLTLQPGLYEISGQVEFVLTGATTSYITAGIGLASATFGAQGNYAGVPAILTTASTSWHQDIPKVLLEVTLANTVVYLIGRGTWSAGTVAAKGFLKAIKR